MNGRIVGTIIMITAVVAGAALYYLQVYGFYREVSDAEAGQVLRRNKLSEKKIKLEL